jgi:hypothetical protein
MTYRLSGFAVLLALAAANVVFGQSVQQIGEMAVRNDIKKFQDDDSWVYDDFDKAIAVAKETNRPLMVVFR